MKNTIFYAIAISLFLIISCTDKGTLDTIDELTVEAFLQADEVLDSISFGKVIPLDSLESPAAPANLNPYVIMEDGESFLLTYTGVEGIYGNSELIIEEGKSYSLEVDYNEKTIRAETFIPVKPTELQLSDTLIYRTKIEDFTDIFEQGMPDPIEVSWEGEEGAFYFVTVDNIEEDPEPINELFDDGERPAIFNVRTEPATSLTFDIDAFQGVTHYGRYKVVVYRVNAEYAALYEDNTSGSAGLNEIRTNVENGFGIFTGLNSITTYFEVKEQ